MAPSVQRMRCDFVVGLAVCDYDFAAAETSGAKVVEELLLCQRSILGTLRDSR